MYKQIVFPVKIEDFARLNKKKTQEYFDWYISHMEERLQYLTEYMHKDDSTVNLDFSVESLIPVWRWFETKIEFCEKDRCEYDDELKKYPEWIHPHI